MASMKESQQYKLSHKARSVELKRRRLREIRRTSIRRSAAVRRGYRASQSKKRNL
jgi:hypothetical protein